MRHEIKRGQKKTENQRGRGNRRLLMSSEDLMLSGNPKQHVHLRSGCRNPWGDIAWTGATLSSRLRQMHIRQESPLSLVLLARDAFLKLRPDFQQVL